MSTDALNSLVSSYRPRNRSELIQLARDYEQRRDQDVLDLVAVAADVSADSILNLGLEPDPDPNLLDAFQRQYPNVSIESLVGRSQEELQGFAHGVKGKLFELLVRNRLNEGERLGELVLLPGQTAELADSPTQAGFDLIIRNEDGSIAELIQLKATNYLAYVKQALERFPQFRVATTSEIDGAAENILQTPISDERLTEHVSEQLAELSEDTVKDIVHQTAETVFDAIPLVPAVVIVVTEGRYVLSGRATMAEALERARGRLGRAGKLTALGATLSFLDAGILSTPTVLLAQATSARLSNRDRMADFLGPRTQILTTVANPPEETHDARGD